MRCSCTRSDSLSVPSDFVLGLDLGDVRLLLVETVRLARRRLTRTDAASMRACSRWSTRGLAVLPAVAANETQAIATVAANAVTLCIALCPLMK